MNFTSPEDRPVVVNSLLAFIHNFRSHSDLLYLLDNYFSQPVQLAAILLLKDLNHSTLIPNGCSLTKSTSEQLLSDFDCLVDSARAPVFAAADLSVLPMTLMRGGKSVEDGAGEGMEKPVFEELRHIRFLLQSICSGNNTFNGSLGSGATRSDPPSTSNPTKLLTAPTKSKQTPKTPCKSELSSYPQSPSTFGSHFSQATATHSPASSLSNGCSNTLNMTTSTPLQSLQSLMLLAASSPAATANGLFQSAQNSPANKKRARGSNRLDQAVRKLTDRLEARGLDNHKNGTELESLNVSSSSSASTTNNLIREDDDYYFYSTPSTPTKDNNNGVDSEIVDNNIKLGQDTDEDETNTSNGNGHRDKKQWVESNKKSKSRKSRPVPQPPVSEAVVFEEDEDELSDNDALSEQSSFAAKDEMSRENKESSMSNDDDGTEKPFSCSHHNCHKKFTNKFLLKKHQFIHTGLRPHACPYCSKRFNRKDNLLRHKKTHLANALMQYEGGRKRHNMLHGVFSEDDVLLGKFTTVKSNVVTPKKKKPKKSSVKNGEESEENPVSLTQIDENGSPEHEDKKKKEQGGIEAEDMDEEAVGV